MTPRPPLRWTDHWALRPAILVLVVAGMVVGFCLPGIGSEGRWITAEVTAYSGNCPLCETTGVTADGTLTTDRPHGVAASPNIRLGSRVFIPSGAGYLDATFAQDRWFTCDDRGGALRSEWHRSGITRLDLRYRTHWSARQFGRKLMVVYVEEP